MWGPEFCQLGQKLKTKDYMAIQHKKVQEMGKVSHLPIDTILRITCDELSTIFRI